MSERHSSEDIETLFSFELLVEYIRIEKEKKVSDELALAVRLLDFPTLLIYQPEQRGDEMKRQKEKRGEYAFNRGKSCVFKMNLHSLHTHLSNSPLYAMLLDVKEEIPKLVGTSLISLAEVMDRIRQDVVERGVSTPSSHGEKGLVGMCDLTGEKIGSMSLSYKLLSLGASLLPHITERRGLKGTTVHRGQHVKESIKDSDLTTQALPSDDCEKLKASTPDQSDVSDRSSMNEDKQDVHVATQTEHKPRSQMPQSLQDTENCFDEDLTVFCPPHLYYTNAGEEKSKNEGSDYRLTQDTEVFTFEDTLSEEESFPVTDPRARHKTKMSNDQEQTSVVTPHGLGEALRQLPLLNALLVELSHLNGQSPHQPLSIHPNLAFIYRTDSTEPPAGQGNTPRKAHTKSSQRSRQGANLKQIHSQRNCSTPILRPACEEQLKNKHREAFIESSRKKLVYGTTKTFNLRLKQISTAAVKRRECMELTQNETKSNTTKGKTKCSHKIMKSSKRNSALNQSSSVDENIQTAIESITADSVQQDTVTLKQKNIHANKVHGKQDKESLQMSVRPSCSEGDEKSIDIPRVESDSVAKNKDNTEHHSESDQSQSESDRRRLKIESSASSRHSSPKSLFSDSSGEGSDEAEYADDFTSLEPSDAYSPDPTSSPEPARARAPKSPIRFDSRTSDSGSESVQRRAVLPVPVKACGSPQRALRGTHIIRPRTQASALSFSSDDNDRDESASVRTVRSGKHTTESSKAERSSVAESVRSSRSQRSESTRNSCPVRGFSAESVSSFEPQEAEELEDELGSLDFGKEYQHISELVANKLPGYTM
ncbi:microtubule-associated protein 10 [Scomber scombrus]|uniref:microtubule-associated protein 10 n=1 Tax=Scomber scombrus TaxID=13677 RepID=UPI002DD8C4D9|nr:microtubule-associated protein 10 [Scomber scombrus]